jgi:hypothetical protein
VTNWLDRLVRFREDRRNPMPVTWLIAALGYPLPFVLGAVFAFGSARYGWGAASAVLALMAPVPFVLRARRDRQRMSGPR